MLISSIVIAAAAPIEVVDALSRRVTLNGPVERVAVNFNFEEFTAVAGIDGWKKVVGISRTPWEGWRTAIFNRYKAVIPNLAAMPDIGHTDDNTFSIEKIISLRPDVLLISEWAYKAIKDGSEKLDAAGIPLIVIDYNAQLLELHLASTRALGKVMGAERRAEELATLYETKYNDVLRRIARANVTQKPKVYVELGGGGPDVVGNTYNNTMWGKLLDVMNIENIAGGKIPGPWGPLNQESVIAENPDAIFIAGSSWLNRPAAAKTGYETDEKTARASLSAYASRAGWGDLKAVKSGNMNLIEHGLCRTLFDFVAMEFIGKQLFPQAFADVDPEASFRAYHERFLPVKYEGTWMLTGKK